jgi:putative transcriptional regulator
MNIAESSDKAAVALIGERTHRERLNQNLTQEALAERAGVGVRTVRHLEGGKPTTLETLIRVLRALGKLGTLDAFLPEPGISPLQLAKLKGRERQRAGTRRHTHGGKE